MKFPDHFVHISEQFREICFSRFLFVAILGSKESLMDLLNRPQVDELWKFFILESFEVSYCSWCFHRKVVVDWVILGAKQRCSIILCWFSYLHDTTTASIVFIIAFMRVLNEKLLDHLGLKLHITLLICASCLDSILRNLWIISCS